MLAESAGITAMSLFNRYCAWRRTHPMSGGISRIAYGRRCKDYIADGERRTFGFELAPLPRSLQLPAAESQRNQVVASVAAGKKAVDGVV